MNQLKSLFITPHPDDETLGCGGTILQRKNNGNKIGWLLITDITTDNGWSKNIVEKRRSEINSVSKKYNFDKVYNLKKPSTKIDSLPFSELISEISSIFNDFQPHEIFLPHWNDIHSDHRVVFEASISSSKSFRMPFIKKILCYETLSETEFSYVNQDKFNPTYYVNVSEYFEEKLQIMKIYESEIGNFPFPRSFEAIKSLAKIRGSRCGCDFAEAFQLIYMRE